MELVKATATLARTAVGILIVRVGETIADAGAKVASCRRLHSELHPMYRTNQELD